MIMHWFSRRNRWLFVPAVYQESREDCPNPGRGWYRLFSMDAAAGAPFLDWRWSQGKGEELALLMVDIGAYAEGPIAQEALENIRLAFSFFREEKKELLLRFVYDREGRGYDREPADISRILRHMEQLAPLLEEFQDILFCIQGLFVGSWGEMHDSRYLTRAPLTRLWRYFNSLAPENCFFAVRKPQQWRMLTGLSDDCLSEEEIRRLRLGLFNDGLLGSETDLGSFPAEARKENCLFQEQLCRFVPNGGEAVGEEAFGEIKNAAAYFRKIRLSYLNSVYDERVLSRWRKSTFQGENGYEYIGRHLGYRFVLTGAGLVKSGKDTLLEIQLENRGFAPIYEACDIRLCGEYPVAYAAECGGKTVLSGPETWDLRQLLPGKKMKIQFDLAGQESGDMILSVSRRRDDRPIRLANRGAGEEFVIGRLNNGRENRN